ncbi:MAG TPA: ABC transporter permease [Terriglobales bacterium]|nr:ABC transporter permease [Terriglobales bacterium]
MSFARTITSHGDETHLGYKWSARQWLPDLRLALENLLNHKLRSMLTMLGMIFGVAAVVTMLSIGAGAQQKVIAFIEQLGVRNVIIEAKEANNDQTLSKVRKLSAGLSFADYRMIRQGVEGIESMSARKRFSPAKLIPSPQQDAPQLYGVESSYQQIVGLRMSAGQFFTSQENHSGAPLCVLGEAAKVNLFGSAEALGKYVKIDNQWFRVIGVAGPQLTAQNDIQGLPHQDLNNVIYAPVNSVIYRMADDYSYLKDEIDGIYLHLAPGAESPVVAEVVRGILNNSHHNAGDFTVIIPATLLAEQKRTERLFNTVMVAIASISLLVGGIGIMNIMLASILERTREIGVRRAVGARKFDIVRQFMIEAVLISFSGGILGIAFGFGMSRLIALLAGWSTMVTESSIALAFVVSISVGIIFGTYPAMRAARLDPVEAIRYE